MKLSDDLLGRLNLLGATTAVMSDGFERLPNLIIDQCLATDPGRVAQQTAASYRRGELVVAETITMPRRTGFGPRPVTIPSTRDRCVYEALVAALRSQLEPSPREAIGWMTAWNEHESFGDDGFDSAGSEYIVELDIASCYEYIDHELLVTELSVQSGDTRVAEAIGHFLKETFGRSVGLPQFLKGSDLLADVYLSAIERELLREGYQVSRYVDDFKVLAQTWGDANSIIERSAEIARSFGLVLSSDKTRITGRAKIRARKEAQDRFLQDYFSTSFDDLTTVFLIAGSYDDDPEVMELEPDKEETLNHAMHKILTDWVNEDQDAEAGRRASLLSQYTGKALRKLHSDSVRISDSVLTEIAFWQPFQLQTVIRYLKSRSDDGPNWTTLKSLVSVERQSPWAKLWLLDFTDLQSSTGSEDEAVVLSWCLSQLEDSHESVRAQAAWVLAGQSTSFSIDFAELYKRASAVSRPAIAAALARSGEPASSPIAKAIRSDSPLCRQAFEWAMAAQGD